MSSIVGFGAYLPERILTNEELATRLGVTPDWIFEKSGIRERRLAAPNESVADLAFAAAQDCLATSGVPAANIGFVICASGSAERRFPGPAAHLAHQLGIPGVPCLDVPMASAGSLFAVSLADQLTAHYGPILIVAAEKMSPIALAEPLEQNTSMLFGDGAGACLLTSGDGPLTIAGSILHSDGAYESNLRLDHNGRLFMNGQTVILQAARKIPSAIEELLAEHHTSAAEVDCFLMHQANQNLILRVAKALNVPGERFYSNIGRYGNTSSASMLIAAAEYFRAHPAQSGNTYCFAAFGAGFHWGALLARAN